MGPNILKTLVSNFLISQNTLADLKGHKGKIICSVDDVRRDLLGSPHGTTPAAVIANKSKTDPLRAVNILMKKGWVIPRFRLLKHYYKCPSFVFTKRLGSISSVLHQLDQWFISMGV